MIPREVFYERLDKHCHACSEWNGRCLRGHDPKSPTGCPLKKFEPIQNASYDEDLGRTAAVLDCQACNKSTDESLPKLTWLGVLKRFKDSMLLWFKAGLPLVSSDIHATRYGSCKACQFFRGYYCEHCFCVAYLKTKVATEKCPIERW